MRDLRQCAFLAIVAALGCGSKPVAAPVTTSAAPSPAAKASDDASTLNSKNSAAVAEISDEECLAFARKLEAAVLADDNSAGELMDWNHFVDAALDGLSTPEKPNQEIENLRIAGRNSKNQLLNTLGKQIKDGGAYTFLRIRKSPEGKRLLFRLLGANGGLNYHEIILGRSYGDVVALDVYLYMAGETASHTFRQMAILNIAEKEEDFRNGSNPIERDFGKNAITSFAMMKAFKEGRFADCLKKCEQLSPLVQKEKSHLLFRVVVASNIGGQDYISAIDTFRTAFPNDPGADLIAIDSLFEKQKFEEARQAIDRIDKSLGGDYYLHVLRANSYLNESRFDEAASEAQAALDKDPNFSGAFWILVTVSLRKQDFSKAAELLTKAKNEYRVDLANMASDPLFADFLKSSEYKKWQAENQSTP